MRHTADPFSAAQALRYVTFLTIGYLDARGLAKSGTRGNARDDHRPAENSSRRLI